VNIKTLAKLTFWGLAYIYTAKLIDTLFHGILFNHSLLSVMIVGLNILAGLVQLLFFIALYRQFVPKDKQTLRIATWSAIVGSISGMLPKLLAMLLLFQQESLFFIIRFGTQIKAFCPWLAAVLLLAFSLIFFFDYRLRQNRTLKFAFAAGAVGWLIMASAQSLVVINYMVAGRLIWLAGLFAAGPIVFVTASSLTFLSLSIFYLTFARR
jgi:hypothetical protein